VKFSWLAATALLVMLVGAELLSEPLSSISRTRWTAVVGVAAIILAAAWMAQFRHWHLPRLRYQLLLLSVAVALGWLTTVFANWIVK
jgi:hypothetical protein